MKKSLLAVAALGAFASAAQAQSSVTVYGILDLGYVGTNSVVSNNAATKSGAAANAVGGRTSTTTNAFTNDAESTSRIGFKGTEDLGGGMSAFFTIESALTPNGSQAFSSSTTAQRQTFVGLKKNGIGQFAVGTQYTTIHNAVSATDPGNANNMMGNVVYDKATGATVTNTTTSAVGNWQYSGQQNNSSYTVRANNMLSLNSDTFAGFQGNAFIVLNQSNTNSGSVAAGSQGYTTGTTNSNGWGLGVNYTWQKLLVTANVQNFSNKSAYAVANSTGQYSAGAPTVPYWGGAAAPGATNYNDNQQYYAATYDFGILKGYLQYVNRKTLDANNPNNYVARTAQQIGVRSYITPTVEAWASAGTGKLTSSSAYTGSNSFESNSLSTGSNAANFGGFQLGSNYWLSKRTNLYAIYGQQHTSNQGYSNMQNPTSYNSNAYALGVRHTF